MPGWIVAAKVILSVLLAGLLGIGTLVGASVNAYYTPWNLTRAQFDASATFGAWSGEGDGSSRRFVLETPEATITGQDTRAMVAQGQVPFGRPSLKAGAIAIHLALAMSVALVLVWGVPWMVGWIRRRIRLGRMG
jgi:hypothetical protein